MEGPTLGLLVQIGSGGKIWKRLNCWVLPGRSPGPVLLPRFSRACLFPDRSTCTVENSCNEATLSPQNSFAARKPMLAKAGEQQSVNYRSQLSLLEKASPGRLRHFCGPPQTTQPSSLVASGWRTETGCRARWTDLAPMQTEG